MYKRRKHVDNIVGSFGGSSLAVLKEFLVHTIVKKVQLPLLSARMAWILARMSKRNSRGSQRLSNSSKAT